jgi:EAL domain-containing protein (putative c-di-GMP-specific phosphodiesterase class I)
MSHALPKSEYRELSCGQCRAGAGLDFDFSFAFQPIVDVNLRRVVCYEALVRGVAGESAGAVLGRVEEKSRYSFDQACRVKAIALAAKLGCDCRLSINFLPNAVYRPELCIKTTLEAAKTYGFPAENITFEFVESERLEHNSHLKNIVNSYRDLGFQTALDDFGTGYSGLSMLAEFQPDIIKIDRMLLTNIADDRPRQAIVEGIVHMCQRLAIKVVAEGVETAAEFRWLRAAGIELFQGYYFARPGFETLPEVSADYLSGMEC